MKALAFVSRWLSLAAMAVAAAGLLAMTVIILWSVAARYLLDSPPAWAEQAALLAMLWFVPIAAAAGVREGFHIALTAGLDALPPRGREALEAVNTLIVLGFGLALAWGGADLALRVQDHIIPTLGVSRALAYLPLPAAGALIALFAAEQLLARAAGTAVEPAWP